MPCGRAPALARTSVSSANRGGPGRRRPGAAAASRRHAARADETVILREEHSPLARDLHFAHDTDLALAPRPEPGDPRKATSSREVQAALAAESEGRQFSTRSRPSLGPRITLGQDSRDRVPWPASFRQGAGDCRAPQQLRRRHLNSRQSARRRRVAMNRPITDEGTSGLPIEQARAELLDEILALASPEVAGLGRPVSPICEQDDSVRPETDPPSII